MKSRLISVLAAASILGLAACGSGSPSSTGGGTAPATGGGDAGLTKVSVGVIPIVDCAP
ncbi:MAG: nitrate ABC transporter substrate-binding protein, partial [Arthrobacter sp.]|nr:nitrate ABC transporter substrate-binding protein [Arthrobacter sp.]